MSSIVFHSVNSTPGIKQGHFDKTEFENFIYFKDKYSFKGDFFFLNKTVATYPNIFYSNAHLLPNYIFCCAKVVVG